MSEVATRLLDRSDCGRDVVHRILEDVVDGIVRRSPFQRALATWFKVAVVPGWDEPKTEILEYACCGLTDDDEQSVARFVSSGSLVSGTRYPALCRMGDCYFIPRSASSRPEGLEIPSHRRFWGLGAWQADDALVIPFWTGEHIAGQISVDDPRDGARPRRPVLHLLEEVASVAALGLEEACKLQELGRRQRQFHAMTERGLLGALVVHDDRILYANEQALEILGYDQTAVLSLTPWWQVLHPDDRPFAWEIDDAQRFVGRTVRATRKDGRTVWLSACANAMEYEGSDGTAVQFFDITDRVQTEEQLKERALRDPLTGFRNRTYFEDAIQTEIKRSTRYRRPFTLMIADLANFKRVNDTLGHQEGDRVLVEVAEILRQQLRESDWAVRYGGDEFLLTLPETGPELGGLAERLRAAVAAWSRDNVRGVSVGIDLGWATWHPDAPQPIESLLREADDRLYEMKRARVEAAGSDESPPNAS